MKDERLTRREFFTAAGIVAGGVTLAACGSRPTVEIPTSYPPTELPRSTATLRPTETPKPSPTATEVPYQLEDGTQMERVEQGQLVDLFPGSEVFMSERGDAVIINKETGLELAGQVVETKYGTFTFLLSPAHYQWQASHLLSEEAPVQNRLDTHFPPEWAKNPAFKEYYLGIFDNLTSLEGYNQGAENYGGYPNMLDNFHKDEIMRIIGTLIDLQERKIPLQGTDLTNYEPQSKDFVVLFTKPGSTYTLANSLPEGLMDPTKELTDPEAPFTRYHTALDLSSRLLKIQDSYLIALQIGSAWEGGALERPDMIFFKTFMSGPMHDTFGVLMREVNRELGLNKAGGYYGDFYEGNFAPLYLNYDSLVRQASTFIPENTIESSEAWLVLYKFLNYYVSEIVEVDFTKFRNSQ